MFELDGGGFPSLTVGNVYEVEEDVDASSSTEFHIIDDNGNQHWFDDFGKSTDDFKLKIILKL